MKLKKKKHVWRAVWVKTIISIITEFTLLHSYYNI